MADSKVSLLTAKTAIVATDQLYFVDPLSKRATISNFIKNIGPSYILTPPVDSQFAWINQGGSTVASGDYGISLVAPLGAGDNFRIREKAPAFSPPYTLTIGLRGLRPDLNFAGVGVGWRQSSDGKLVVANYNFGAVASLSNIQVAKYTNVTTFSASYITQAINLGSEFWMKIQDNNVNRIVSVSLDGTNFLQIHSVVRNDFLVGDRIFFFANPNNGTQGVITNLFSWKEENI
jgi:hypothetical protein